MNLNDKDLSLSLITGLGIALIYIVKFIKKVFNKISFISIKTGKKEITMKEIKKDGRK